MPVTRKINKPTTTHMEDTVFALKQTIAKLRHELHAKDGVITCLKQDIVDLQDKLKYHEKFKCGWSYEDVLTHASEREIDITKDEAYEIIDHVESSFDASVGVSWDTIYWAVDDHVERRKARK